MINSQFPTINYFEVNAGKHSGRSAIRYRKKTISRQKGAGRAEFIPSQQGSAWNFFLIGIVMMFLMLGFGLFYVHQITGSAVGGYNVSALEKKANELKEAQRQLELQAAEKKSLKNLEKRAQRLNFIPSKSVRFTSPVVSGAIALSEKPLE